jgi:membrane carboxypeptidase/penicillin-binding protein PbpC
MQCAHIAQPCRCGLLCRDPGTIWPAAAKPRTSNDFRDSWTVGYTATDVLGVWVGNNVNTPMVKLIGITGAGPIWHDCVLLMEHGKPAVAFPVPGGLVKKTVQYLGITTTDWYLQ